MIVVVTASSGDRLPTGPPALGYAALGATVMAGTAAAGFFRRGTALLGRAVDRAPQPVTNAVDSLAERGRRDLATLAATAEATVEWAIPYVARYPPLLRFVDEMVDAVLPSAIATALPDVLDQLAREPEGVRAVVRAQSTDISDELLALVRTRAQSGDDLVDRVVRGLRLRRRRVTEAEAIVELGPEADGGGLALQP
jgi:hypothetical protein